MRTLFDGEVQTDYSQFYVTCHPQSEADFVGAFAGQVNGLCGGALPGLLYLMTGLYYGRVGFTVELHDEAPPVDDSWEEIVEVSFTPTAETMDVVELFRGSQFSLTVPLVELRVRYCARGVDEAWETRSVFDGEPIVDRYLLQFWPAPAEVDRVVKQTSAQAAYRHDVARRSPPPPTPAEKAEAERLRAEAERQAQLEAQERLDQMEAERHWGGVRPTERVRRLPGNVIGLAGVDRGLVDALADADPDVQRSIAQWATRRAWDAAGLSSLDWAAPALAALERGEQLPPPFDDRTGVWTILLGEGSQVQNVHVETTGTPGIEFSRNIDPQFAALPAIFAAVDADPLVAAVDALFAAAITFGDEHPRLLRELRNAFPQLG